MKITFYSTYNLQHGCGGERWLIDMANCLANIGHSVIVLHNSKMPTHRKTEITLDSKVEVKPLKLIGLGKFRLPLKPSDIACVLKSSRTSNLTYLMDIGDPITPLILALLKIRTIVGLHGGLGSLIVRSKSLSRAILAYMKFLEKIGVKFHTITATQHLRVRNYSVKKAYFSYLNIDCSFFPKKPHVEEKSFNVIWVGRRHRDKGLGFLEEVAKHMPDSVRLYIVGLNYFPVERDNIVNMGFISEREKLCQIYSKAHILLQTSKIETFGLVTIEALVSGLPLVATPTPLIRELREIGFGKYISVVDNPEKTVNSIIQYYRLWSSNVEKFLMLKNEISRKARKIFCLSKSKVAKFLNDLCGK
mgnify:CR=1 FL=1